jgi:hypothetical protein
MLLDVMRVVSGRHFVIVRAASGMTSSPSCGIRTSAGRKSARGLAANTAMPYIKVMRAATVISTKHFDSMVEGLLGADELAALEFALATNPTAHPVIPGLRGVRKARWSRPGTGKRGGVRVIYYYVVRAEVVGLIAVYAKNEKENLNDADKKVIRKITEWFETTV